MQKGDTIKARFMTLPSEYPGSGANDEKRFLVRKGTVVYVHPKGRYIVAAARRGAGDILPGGGADMSEFPERLRKLRERKRLKRYVLSERCGLNSDAIRRYELGTAKPTMDALKSIADEFGVSVDYLMGRTDYPCVVDIAEK